MAWLSWLTLSICIFFCFLFRASDEVLDFTCKIDFTLPRLSTNKFLKSMNIKPKRYRLTNYKSFVALLLQTWVRSEMFTIQKFTDQKCSYEGFKIYAFAIIVITSYQLYQVVYICSSINQISWNDKYHGYGNNLTKFNDKIFSHEYYWNINIIRVFTW